MLGIFVQLQWGKVATEEDQAKFTRMKEAYEVLSDTHKRETYDAIGERGMKWLEEPFSIDLQEMAHNFATSSVQVGYRTSIHLETTC